jgi:hypothetical protein
MVLASRIIREETTLSTSRPGESTGMDSLRQGTRNFRNKGPRRRQAIRKRWNVTCPAN